MFRICYYLQIIYTCWKVTIKKARRFCNAKIACNDPWSAVCFRIFLRIRGGSDCQNLCFSSSHAIHIQYIQATITEEENEKRRQNRCKYLHASAGCYVRVVMKIHKYKSTLLMPLQIDFIFHNSKIMMDSQIHWHRLLELNGRLYIWLSKRFCAF